METRGKALSLDHRVNSRDTPLNTIAPKRGTIESRRLERFISLRHSLFFAGPKLIRITSAALGGRLVRNPKWANA
jgi:hypothetical protein